MISEQIAIVSYYIRKKGGDPVTEDEASFNYFRDWITEQLYEEGVFVKEDYWIHLKDVFSDAPNLISGLFKIVGASLKHPYMLLQLIQQRVVGEKISYRLVLKFINRLSSCPVSVMSGSQCMIIGIDAFNIRAGGGVTHLVELLRAADPITHGFKRIIIWGGAALLAKIEDRDWLFKIHEPLLDCGLPCRAFWERFRLKKLARQAGCDVVFVPGSSDASGFKPIVTMNQNLLPFEWREMRRYGWSFATLKFILLRWTQSRSFRKAEGVIDLTQHAQDIVLGVTGAPHGQRKIVPHGINPRFFCPPRPQRCFDDAHPCRVLYVSIVDVYKHQWRVAEAIAQLRSEGFPVVLELVGPAWEGMRQLKNAMNRLDPGCVFLTYRGAVLYEKLHEYYAAADIGVFASSCESMSNILAESMAAGLPIACSYRASMPEVLGDAGVYFDPEDSNDIARALRTLLDSPALRSQLAKAAFERAQQYSWKRCANETFGFLAECHRSFLKQTS